MLKRKNPIAIWLAGCLLLLVLVLVGDSEATSVIPQTLSELTDANSHIVRGDVRAIDSRWNADRTLIVTDISLWIGESFKGAARGQIIVTLPGGRIDDLVLDVVGVPSFALEEEVVLFLQRGEDDNFLIPDLYQGKFRLTTEEDGTTWLSNDHSTLPQLLPGRASSLTSSERMPFESFRSELESALRGGAR